MTSLQDCIDGLVVAVASVEGVNAYSTVDEAISGPAGIVSIDQVEFVDMDEGLEVQASVAVLIDRSFRDQWDALVELVDPTNADGIPAAIVADRTLGGRVASVALMNISQLGTISWGGSEWYGALVRVEILGTSDG